MGLDVNAIFGNAAQAIEQSGSDAWNTIGQSGVAYAESSAIQILQNDAASHIAAAQSSTTDILHRPTSAGSFGAFLQNMVQNPVLKEYGPYVVAAVVGIVILKVLL